MTFIESETIELKSSVVADLCKEVIAFANTRGGTLYIGVEDNGTVIGVDSADRVTLQINNMVRDSIKPDITAETLSDEFFPTTLSAAGRWSKVKFSVT